MHGKVVGYAVYNGYDVGSVQGHKRGIVRWIEAEESGQCNILTAEPCNILAVIANL